MPAATWTCPRAQGRVWSRSRDAWSTPPWRRWVAAQPTPREGTLCGQHGVAGRTAQPPLESVLMEPVHSTFPSGMTMSFSSGPPLVKRSGLQACNGLPDTLWPLPRNSWKPRAGPQLCGQRLLPKHLIQYQAAPSSPGNPTLPPEPPSVPVKPRGPVPSQLHGGDPGAAQGSSAELVPQWATCQRGCRSLLGAFSLICCKSEELYSNYQAEQPQKSEQVK